MDINRNKSELIKQMDRLGCFNGENAEKANCKKLYGILITSNESDGYNNLLRSVDDDYSIVNHVAIASYSLAILLNSALLWMMYKDSLKRFRTPSSLLIANLAISDLLGACFSLAIEAETLQAEVNTAYNTSASTTLYLPWLVVTMAQSSYYTVILISCERYAAIAHPFRYRDLVVTKNTLVVILISWLLAFTISTPLFFIQRLIKITTGNKIYAINTFILIAIILVLYPLTHSSLRRQRKIVLAMNANNSRLRINKLKVEKNFANTMFLVYFSLILFTSPYVVVFFLTTKCNSCILNNHFLNIWLYYRIFFAIHFGVNPVLYAWRLPCYRESLCQLVNLLLSPFKKRHAVRAHAQRDPSTPATTSVEKASASKENGNSLTLTTSIDKSCVGNENAAVSQSETQT